MVEPSAKRWSLVLVGLFLAYAIVVAVYFHHGGGAPAVAPPSDKFLVTFADIAQLSMMSLCFVLAVRQSLRSQGRARVFWALMACGFGTWSFTQAGWAYYEIILGKQIPDPFWADIVLFFHYVPYTAALVVRPHLPGEVRKIALSAIDWTMLLLWWLYLYVFLVWPPQFIAPDQGQYDASYNTLYLAENVVWLAILAFLFVTTRNEWKVIYGQFLAAGTLYTVASQIINWAITSGQYYSGSIYDLPLTAAALWFVWAIATAPVQVKRPESADEMATDELALGSRLAMLALLSIPVMAGWLEITNVTHDAIYRFRMVVSLIGIVVLGSMVFLKQYLIDRERVRLLVESRQNYQNLQRVQQQLLQSEKLASIGQLVSGAAHEINNPLTAILGYSELLESHEGADGTVRGHAAKIKMQALRTKSLVGNLLKFARQSSADKRAIRLNQVVEGAVRLRQMEISGKSIRYLCNLEPELPAVWGDMVQLTDVCLQLLTNAADVIDKDGIIEVKTFHQNDRAVLDVIDNGPGISDPGRVFDPFYTTKGLGKGTGLGLSVCYGIIAAHGGEITGENLPEGGARFRVTLPLATSKMTSTASAGGKTA